MRSAFRWLLAAAMGYTGIAHLVATDSFLGQVPSFLPLRSAIIVVSGGVEIAFATALALSRGERLRQTGWALAIFYVAIFPGNIYQAIAGTDAFGLDTPAARWGRLALQPILIAWALWSTGAWPRPSPVDDSGLS